MIAQSRHGNQSVAARSAARPRSGQPRRSRTRSPRRRGVLLIIVLAILAAFGLITLAFVVVTSHSHGTSIVDQRIEQYYDPPEADADKAIHQLLVGSPVRAVAGTPDASGIGAHGLLEDVYGGEYGQAFPGGSLTGTVGSVNPPTISPRIVSIVPSAIAPTPTAPVTTAQVLGAHVGCILTFTSGANVGTSCRIVNFDTSTSALSLLFDDALPAVAANDLFVINGVPFSGTGHGTPNNGHLNDDALWPRTNVVLGGANSDYDAPDYQNMFMAALRADGSVMLPSFHRSDLCRYWVKRDSGNPSLDFTQPAQFGPQWQGLPVARKRQILFRPLSDDHPNFTGSNPNFNPLWDGTAGLGYAWDVDNAGTGIPDSIWLDLGFPARTMPDGRRYKPLFAFLCVDLDGRLNLNAHGSTKQLDAANYSGPISGPWAGANANTPQTLVRGEGYGPADVDLVTGLTMANARPLMLGGVGADGRPYEGRYGEIGIAPNTTAEAGKTNDSTVANAALSLMKHWEFPDNYVGQVNTLPFGSPPDLWGRGAFALDFLGQPSFVRPNNDWSNEVTNTPYRLNLGLKSPKPAVAAGSMADNAFTVAELERILRPYDRDASKLAQRLAQLAPGLVQMRNRVTTESFSIPAPPANGMDPDAAIQALHPNQPQSIVQLLRARLEAGGVAANQVDAEIKKLLAWDLLRNLKMDINRPLGSGGSSYATAQPDQGWDGIFAAANNPIPFQFANGVDVNNDGVVDQKDQLLARQLMARHLYVLMMLLWDQNYLEPMAVETPALLAADQKELFIRRIAQWAINVVEFRDADGTMTPFEYDVNPFNGWDDRIDGILDPDPTLQSSNDNRTTVPERRLVWGCEQPELVLSESFAIHDRRVADTAFDRNTRKKLGPNQDDDKTADQPQIPQGSLFLEVYCPRNSLKNNVATPQDLYNPNGTLDLNRKTPGNVPYPVWRIVISESTVTANNQSGNADNDVLTRWTNQPNSTSFDPEQSVNDPTHRFSLLSASTGNNVKIDRILWLANLPPTTQHTDYKRVYYARGAAALNPGGYLVLGPRPTTYLGALTRAAGGQWGAVKARPNYEAVPAITLNPVGLTGGTNAFPVNFFPPGQDPLGLVVAADWLDANDQPMTVPVDVPPIGISVSEPLPGAKYYDVPTSKNPDTGIQDAYGDLTETDALLLFPDIPFDGQQNRPLVKDGLLGTKTTEGYKYAFLQRVANPSAPYHPFMNPYLTVDWLPIDLTVFNGEDTIAVGTDPDDMTPSAQLGFASRMRGKAGNPRLWSPLSDPPKPKSSTPVNGWNFSYRLDPDSDFSLGFVNQTYGKPWLTPPDPAYRGTPATSQGTPDPFPWLTWNNRPYASAMELALVPSSHPGRLPAEIGVISATSPNPYVWSDAAASMVGGFGAPFSHLTNFFVSPGPPANPPSQPPPPTFGRLFDYVHTPSRFVGMETVLNAAMFQAGAGSELLRPPFSSVSHYREPGKVNANTVSDQATWDAVRGGAAPAGVGPSFTDILQSRCGSALGFTLPTDGLSPTFINNPFRSASAANWTPYLNNAPVHTNYPSRGVNVSLLRADTTAPDNGTKPLFSPTTNPPPGAYCDPTQNAYFEYQALSRLQNSVTTQSNVYAVWVTVGYFEVSPTAVDTAHPDGLQLGAELGLDSGEVKRHRAFYIIDRTIPVGFQRGQNLNADKTILLKRYIE